MDGGIDSIPILGKTSESFCASIGPGRLISLIELRDGSVSNRERLDISNSLRNPQLCEGRMRMVISLIRAHN